MNQCVSGPSTGLAPSHRSPRRIPGGGENAFSASDQDRGCVCVSACACARARVCIHFSAGAAPPPWARKAQRLRTPPPLLGAPPKSPPSLGAPLTRAEPAAAAERGDRPRPRGARRALRLRGGARPASQPRRRTSPPRGPGLATRPLRASGSTCPSGLLQGWAWGRELGTRTPSAQASPRPGR